MRKVKYYFNTHTLRYEKLTTPLRVRLLQVIGYIAASIVTGIIISLIVFSYIDSPEEKMLRQQNDDLKQNYSILKDRINQLELKSILCYHSEIRSYYFERLNSGIG